MKNVAIIHPWMPQYRAPFLGALAEELHRRSISLQVFYGDPPPEWADRGDAVSPHGMTRLPTRFFRVGGRHLNYKSLRAVRQSGPYDLIILEQAIRNIETYRLLLSKSLYRRIAFWGHGRTYTARKSNAEEAIKSFVTKRSDWFFGYTQGGVDSVVRCGYPIQKVSVVQNAIDSESLRRWITQVGENEVSNFRERYSLTDYCALYLGGLDESKRIPFLLESARRIHQIIPEFRLVIAGNGEMAGQVKRLAEDSPWLSYIGPVFEHEKALALSVPKLLMIPGRVGLVAVDSLVAGTPIVTTDWPYHAPEFEYLTPNETCVVTEDTIDAFVRGVCNTITNADLLARLKSNCQDQSKYYNIETMVRNFADGICAATEGVK